MVPLGTITPFEDNKGYVAVALQVTGKEQEVKVPGSGGDETWRVRPVWNLGLGTSNPATVTKSAAIDRFEVLAPGQVSPTIVPAWVVGQLSDLESAMAGTYLPEIVAAVACCFDITHAGLKMLDIESSGFNLARVVNNQGLPTITVTAVAPSAAACPGTTIYSQSITNTLVFTKTSRAVPVADDTLPLHFMVPVDTIAAGHEWTPLSFTNWIRWHFDNPVELPEKEISEFKKYEDSMFCKTCFGLGGWPSGSRFPRTVEWLADYYKR